MFSGNSVLGVLLFGTVIGVVLSAVGVVKTVQYQWWGKQTWTPPAKPWLAAAAAVLVLTLVGGIIWATSS